MNNAKLLANNDFENNNGKWKITVGIDGRYTITDSPTKKDAPTTTNSGNVKTVENPVKSISTGTPIVPHPAEKVNPDGKKIHLYRATVDKLTKSAELWSDICTKIRNPEIWTTVNQAMDKRARSTIEKEYAPRTLEAYLKLYLDNYPSFVEVLIKLLKINVLMDIPTAPTADEKPTPGAKPDSKTKVKAKAKVNDSEKTDALNDLKYAFESAYLMGIDCGEALNNLSTAIVHSVLNKVIDPQRTHGQTANVQPSNYGRDTKNRFESTPVKLKRGLIEDLNLLKSTQIAIEESTVLYHKKNGDVARKITNSELNRAAAKLASQCLSDGMDLVQESNWAIWDATVTNVDRLDGEIGFLDKTYNVKRLSKRVYIQLDDSAAYTEVQTSPILEAYRAVRRQIESCRAVRVDPKSGYVYISLSELTENGNSEEIDAIYYRAGKYADIGGEDINGNYTAGLQTAINYESTIEKLNLTDRQTEILHLKERKWGYKAIGTYLGIEPGTVQKTLKRMREKCEKIGFTPDMWKEITGFDVNDD